MPPLANTTATAQIIPGFMSFGILHMKPGKLDPWQWLMIITGLITFVIAVAFWWVQLFSHRGFR
jgi:heme/copper-type cytochrome/quinol oxidase subunit 4